MPLVQGQRKNQWHASTGHLNCSLESTARPALPTLMSGPALLNAMLRYFVHPPGMPISATMSWEFSREIPLTSVTNRLFQSCVLSLSQDQTQLIRDVVKHRYQMCRNPLRDADSYDNLTNQDLSSYKTVCCTWDLLICSEIP